MMRRYAFASGIVLGCALACNTPQPTPTPEPTPTPGPYVPSERVIRSCSEFADLEMMEAAHTMWTAEADAGTTKAEAIEIVTGFCSADGAHEDCFSCYAAVIDDAYGED